MMTKAWPDIDLKALRMALSNVGISALESDEMLVACLSENLTGLLLAINNRPNALMEMAHRALAAEAELARRDTEASESIGTIFVDRRDEDEYSFEIAKNCRMEFLAYISHRQRQPMMLFLYARMPTET